MSEFYNLKKKNKNWFYSFDLCDGNKPATEIPKQLLTGEKMGQSLFTVSTYHTHCNINI